MGQILYVAINKQTGKVMTGAKAQAAFLDKGTLGRSVGQAYQYAARKEGVKVKDLYEIHEIDLEETMKGGN
jgi:hypothetical protein